ncbi:hypothetical protein [Paenibacillus sp. NPDC055715]
MKIISGVVDATATAYFLSYKCLMNKHLEECEYNSDYFSAYFVPAITTAAFSCELALKSICQSLNGKAPKGHDLYKLFKTLDESTRKDIMNRTINAYNLKSEILKVDDRIDENNFNNLLTYHKDSFTIWRYFYEGSPSIDLDFIEALMFCLNKIEDDYSSYIINQLSIRAKKIIKTI